MRNAVAILALCCLLLLTTGYQLFYVVRIAEAKREMTERLRLAMPDDFKPMVFSAEELTKLEWEESTEFRYRGEMYDVVKLETRQGKTLIWCLADGKETALIEQFLKTQKQTSEPSSGNVILKLVEMQYIACSFAPLPAPWPSNPSASTLFLFHLPSVPIFVSTPPPRVC